MDVMYGHEMFILHEAKAMQTEEEIRDFRGGRGINFFRHLGAMAESFQFIPSNKNFIFC